MCMLIYSRSLILETWYAICKIMLLPTLMNHEKFISKIKGNLVDSKRNSAKKRFFCLILDVGFFMD